MWQKKRPTPSRIIYATGRWWPSWYVRQIQKHASYLPLELTGPLHVDPDIWIGTAGLLVGCCITLPQRVRGRSGDR